MLLTDLRAALIHYNPADVLKFDVNCAEKLFGLARFCSKWPESINTKLFANHINAFSGLQGALKSQFQKTKPSKSPITVEDITFFVRTYRGDVCWLDNLLSSIRYFASGSSVVICVERQDEEYIRPYLDKNITVVLEESFCPGTIQQKYSKLTADLHCNTNYVIYLDSDTALVKPFEIDDWFFSGKPCLEYTSYADINNWFKEHNIKGGTPEIWRRGVSNAVGYPVGYDFSRRIEKVYKLDWLKEMRGHIERVHSVSFKEFMARQKGKQNKDDADDVYFSDFNFMGAYLWRYQRGAVFWLNTSIFDFWTRDLNAVQFHSYTMTEVCGNEKQINQIPKDFMAYVYSVWEADGSPESKMSKIRDRYSRLRAENHY